MIYEDYDLEERARYNNFFYGTLFNDTIRENVYRDIFGIVKKKLYSHEMSLRIRHIMERLQSTNNVILQHAFIFFSLTVVQEVEDYIYTKYNGKEKKEKILKYMRGYIKKQTEKLLIGGFKSLSEYIDDNRVNILLQLGVTY
tara:strand:- start:2270 stop:2695 length:426 start_codon:yes stop_codon:yes gene_type:complete